MPSLYTTSLRLTLPATGELSGQWGNTVNTGITELLDAAVAGTASISTWGGAGVAYTLSNNSGAADEARKMFIVATGSPGEAKNVICPAVSKFYVFRNDTTGGFALTLKTSGGTGIAVPAGQYKFLYCDGTNVVEMFNSAGALTLSGALSVGGTTTLAANPTLSAGTANGVLYLNGSKVATSGSALTFDGSNLGIGTSSPGTKLDIRGSSVGGNFSAISVDNTAAGSGSPANTVSINFSNAGAVKNSITGAVYGDGYLAFATNDNTEKLRLTAAGNLGLGVTPSAWNASFKAYQVGNQSLWSTVAGNGYLTNNAFFNTSNAYVYRHDGFATEYIQSIVNGSHSWYTAPSGTAGNAISFTQSMTLDASGRLQIGTTTQDGMLTVVAPASTGYGTFDAANSGFASINFKTGGTAYAYIGSANAFVTGGTANDFAIRSQNALTFAAGGGSERARITSDGYFGIGTTPTSQLHVSGSSALATRTSTFESTSTVSTSLPILRFNRTTTNASASQWVGSIDFDRNLTDGSSEKTASILVVGNNNAGSSDAYMYYRALNGHYFQTGSSSSPSLKATLTSAGNFKIGGTSNRATTEGTNQLVLFNGTAPAGTLTNGVSIYSSSGEAYVMDAAGNATLFSPHDKETNEWIFKSKHTPTGKVLRIDVEKLLRFVNDHFGLDAVQEFIEQP